MVDPTGSGSTPMSSADQASADRAGADQPRADQPRADQAGDAAPRTTAVPVQSDGTTGRVDTTMTFSLDMGAALTPEAGVSGEEAEAITALPSGSALLVVRRGPNIGARFLLDSDVTTAGRHPDADIFLDDVTVSRKHAQFLRTGASFVVKDLGSLNGTYFDGTRIDEAPLADGSEVQVGKFRLTFYASRVDLARLATA